MILFFSIYVFFLCILIYQRINIKVNRIKRIAYLDYNWSLLTKIAACGEDLKDFKNNIDFFCQAFSGIFLLKHQLTVELVVIAKKYVLIKVREYNES